MTTLDLTLLPLYRLNQQELTTLPGLLAMTAPRKTARGRENDRLIIYLMLTGNATLTTAEYLQLTTQTVSKFFETPGALTSAMRAAAISLNEILLIRNRKSASQGNYAIGSLVLAALRGANCTLLQTGPSHIFTLNSEGLQHSHDPALSGKGLGLSQAVPTYFTQTELQPGDKLIFSGKTPDAWERVLAGESRSSIEAIRRRLFSLSHEDINAVIVHAQNGTGNLTVLRPAPSAGHAPKTQFPAQEVPTHPPVTESLQPSLQPSALPVSVPTGPGIDNEGTPDSHPIPVQPKPEPESETFSDQIDPKAPPFTPSAYAIPLQVGDETLPEIEEVLPEFPSSLPRFTQATPQPEIVPELDEPIMDEPDEPKEPREPSKATRQVARSLISGIKASRTMGDAFTRSLGKFLPNLLPGSEGGTISSSILMVFIAIVVPLLVVTAGSTAYLRYGRSYQYDNYYLQAESARAQAESATDPTRQRDGWQAVLFYIDKAEFYRSTPESDALRTKAQKNLDELLGIQRLNFYPVFSSGVNAKISRLAANETDLYMLDAESGRVLHASQTGTNFEMDPAFLCGPGEYGQNGDYVVGPIVDIQILPRLNALNAAVVGIDASGNLLYCSPGQVGQAIPLITPDTNWGRVTGFMLEGGFMYVLDAPSRAIWVYTGQDASFPDRPFFYFGSQIPEIEDAIDLVVNNDELYLLHADGHISRCSYSRLDTVPTRCEDPVTLLNTIPAYQGIDLFAQSHITQIVLTAPPDMAMLMLDADNRSLLRISPRTLELQSQIYPKDESSIKFGPASAIMSTPSRVLFMAVEDQVYFSTDLH